MLRRLYVHNFRCLENFEFKPGDKPSALMIGRNGTGKSTVARALKIFQSIGRGVTRVSQLVEPGDFAMGRSNVPVRLELDVVLDGIEFRYTLALELPGHFRELRVSEEILLVNGVAAFMRIQAQVGMPQDERTTSPVIGFGIDWHLIALPLLQDTAMADSLQAFRQWLARMVLLAPIPRLMSGNSSGESLEPLEDGSNFADWITGLLAQFPSAYSALSQHLKEVMPDLGEFKNLAVGRDAKALMVQFADGPTRFELAFDKLSDGEKCFFLCAVVLAANKAYGPLFVFWDEPDNYLSLNEVRHFVMALRRGFQAGGQILVTSHSEATIRSFSRENTWIIDRKSHLEPALLRLLDELPSTPDVIQSLLAGELEL